MNILNKLKHRNLSSYTQELSKWTQFYGVKDGISIFRGLYMKNGPHFQMSTSFFQGPVYLRDNYSDKAIFRQVFLERQYVLDNEYKIQAKRIIDAGANVGYASLYFAKEFPGAEIVAIEPQNDNFEILKKNTAPYQSIKIKHAAIWNKTEMVSIANPDSLAASFMIEKSSESSIPGITIQNIIDEQGWDSVDIVKMDIEGAEKEVFSEGTEWLQKTKLLIIELHDRYKPLSTKTFFKALEPFDYTAHFHHENIFIFFNHPVK